MKAYINNISTALPPNDVHQKFIDYAATILPSERLSKLFKRMADRSQIEHRYSYLQPTSNPKQFNGNAFYIPNNFPTTQTRMQFEAAIPGNGCAMAFGPGVTAETMRFTIMGV